MYGNGQSAHYGYDDFKRLRSVRFDDETGAHFHYDHGANGRVMTVQDYSPPERTFVSETDSAGRPVRCVLSSGTSHLYTGMATITSPGTCRRSGAACLHTGQTMTILREVLYAIFKNSIMNTILITRLR